MMENRTQRNRNITKRSGLRSRHQGWEGLGKVKDISRRLSEKIFYRKRRK